MSERQWREMATDGPAGDSGKPERKAETEPERGGCRDREGTLGQGHK